MSLFPADVLYSLQRIAYRLMPLLWCVLFLCFSGGSFAQAPETQKPSDVRIIVDISGSMKKNDPQNLRRPALDMLVKLLPEDSKAGVWAFGQYVNMLVKHREVDNDWKQEADSKSSAINSIAQFTNIGEALEKAAYDQGYSTKDQYQTHIILLTDGMVDINRNPSANKKERNRILDDILPMYQKAGYTIHTISLSDKADKKLMDRLALATHGKSAVAKTADELMNVFLDVFDQAVPKEEVPLEGNRFATDSSIEEFTALIFRQPNTPEARLIAPDNSEYDRDTKDSDVNWYHTDKYDLITVKRPLEGEWRVVAELEPQSRITIVSDLSLVVKPIPANLLVDDIVDLSLALREENNIVKRAEFLDLLDIDVTVSYLDKNKDWSQRLSGGLVPGNGVYQTQLDYFKRTGQYQVNIVVDGKSFKRQYTRKTNVRTPFKVETDTTNKKGKTLFNVSVIPQTQSIDFSKTEVVGKLKKPSGSSQIKALDFTDEQIWKMVIEPKEDGVYHLTLRAMTVNDRGDSNDIILKPLSFQYPQADGVFEAMVEKEPELIIDDEPEPVSEKKQEKPKKPEQKQPDKKEEQSENSEEEALDEEAEPDGDMTQWILYGVLAVVNILIILVIYILYRKLFGGKKADNEEEEVDEVSESEESAPITDAALAFEEPPMDEMAIDDSGDDDIDLSEDTSADMNIAEEEDPLAGLTPEVLDDDDVNSTDDEDPEFSLDDFAPDALDDDEDDKA